MENIIVEPRRPQMTIWCLRIACRITKANETHTRYVIIIAIPRQQWLHERASLLPYIYVTCVVSTNID
jgi:hypothetical protein